MQSPLEVRLLSFVTSIVVEWVDSTAGWPLALKLTLNGLIAL
jgi:hypothetical protein